MKNLKLAQKIITLAFAFAILAGLSACGDGDNKDTAAQDKSANAPVQSDGGLINFNTNGGSDVNEKLLEAIKTKPIKGGEIVPRPGVLVFDVPANGSRNESVRLTNQGDEAVKILQVITTTEQRGLALSGACSEKPSVAPGEFCDLTVTYKDQTGRSLDTSIFITTDSKRTPQITVSMSINIQSDKSSDSTPVGPSIDLPPPPVLTQRGPISSITPTGPDPRLVQQLADARSRRASGSANMGRIQANAGSELVGLTPKKVIRSTDPRYDPEAYLWTESSLPVNRSKILTVDRVIPAVLETPVTNIMCNQVVAVIDKDVYSPDSNNILIPHGSRAIGQCQAFADDRVNIQWSRIITPNGVSVRFNKLLGDSADASGQGGVPGQREYKKFDRYGLPIISTSIDVLSSISRALFGSSQDATVNNQTNTVTQSISAVDTALNEFNGRVTPQLQQIIKDIADVREMVVVPGGTRIEIVPQEDIYFKSPYEAVRLADVEYDVRHPVMPPTLYEQPAPSYLLQPQMSGTGQGAVQINGRYYTLQSAPVAQDPSQNPSQTGTAPSSVVYPTSGTVGPGTTSYVPNASTGAPEAGGGNGQQSYSGQSIRGPAMAPAEAGGAQSSSAYQPYAYSPSTGMAYPPAQQGNAFYTPPATQQTSARNGYLPADSAVFAGQTTR